MRALSLFIAFILALGCQSMANAGATEDCDQSQDNDRRVSGCSLIIDGRANGQKQIAFQNRGDAYDKKGEYDRAIPDYDHALALDPKNSRIYFSRGFAYEKKREISKAIADYTRATEVNPEYAAAYTFRGNAYEKMGEHDKAFADFTRAIALDPKDAYTFVSRGNAYVNRQEHTKALADFTSAIKQDPRYVYAYAVRGDVYEKKGERDKALADFTRAIEQDPKYAYAYFLRGGAYEKSGESDKAVSDYSRAIELDPQDFYKRSLAHAQNMARQPAATQSTPTAVASAGRRVALVIGNSNYSDASTLANPANDALVVAAALRRLGFVEVIERYNLDLVSMTRAIKEFGDKTADADWAVVYYAGHGIEMNGVSYLVPTDAKLLRDKHVMDEALPLDRVLDKVETARKLRLVILDACRNNPFVARMVRTAGLKRSIGRGLAPLEPEGGVLVAYSAKHGTTAEDGEGANSPFAKALVTYLEEPGLEIQFLFRKVRDRVLAETGGTQEPFLYGSLGAAPLYFVAKP